MSTAEAALGLTSAEAARRLAADGPNELIRGKRRSRLMVFLGQFKSPMILLLLGAAGVAGFLGDVTDAVAIVAVVVLNAVVGFLEESKGEEAIRALRDLTAPRASVLRDGRVAVVPAREVVVGDVLVLSGGDLVAADATVVEAHRLTTSEATLTGESAPIEKRVEPAPPGAPLAEQVHRVFMASPVLDGTGRAVVTAIGMGTELGRIANLLESTVEEDTPLQKQLARVGRSLVWLCLLAVAAVAVLDLVRGKPLLDLFIFSISLAVAAVPEGLPAIVTIALAVGVQRMARRRVLVRNLPAVEALGSATVIATDKTGTLTTGQMVVREIWGEKAEVLRVAAACCDAELKEDGTAVGDPTEVAILEAARAVGLDRRTLERENPRLGENPFDSTRKRMSVHRADGALFVKGAIDTLLPLCVGRPDEASQVAATFSDRGLRVLGVAKGVGPEERDLTLVGLLGLADPPRPSAVLALADARQAGIHVVMMTGDHPRTAEAIAREMKLVVTGESSEGRVYARVTPEDKLRIVKELKAKGHLVAVTGDGTNDAPALKEAHVGIAMGQTGVEVTREAADLVLADDDFASIIAAVKEGRGIFKNIRKSLVYLLGGNVAELLLVGVTAALALPLPLLPLHLLWINLVTDSLPALALGVDPVTEDVLKERPRPPQEPMLGRRQWWRVARMGALIAPLALVPFLLLLDDLTTARSMAFSTVVFSRVFMAPAARSVEHTFFEVGAFTNPRLLWVLGGTTLLQLGVVWAPPSARLLGVGGVTWWWALVALGLGLVPASLMELAKLVRRKGGHTPRSGPLSTASAWR